MDPFTGMKKVATVSVEEEASLIHDLLESAGFTTLLAWVDEGGHPHLIPRNLFVGNRIPLAGVAHQNGTIRFGNDAATSALDANCRAHEVDNLYVVDGSFFPSSGAVNPALTIMANAIRVGDHLLERLGATSVVTAGAMV